MAEQGEEIVANAWQTGPQVIPVIGGEDAGPMSREFFLGGFDLLIHHFEMFGQTDQGVELTLVFDDKKAINLFLPQARANAPRNHQVGEGKNGNGLFFELQKIGRRQTRLTSDTPRQAQGHGLFERFPLHVLQFFEQFVQGGLLGGVVAKAMD